MAVELELLASFLWFYSPAQITDMVDRGQVWCVWSRGGSYGHFVVAGDAEGAREIMIERKGRPAFGKGRVDPVQLQAERTP